MQDVLEPILQAPGLRRLINELEARWDSEQRLREEFYDKIQPGDKWEFINGKIIMHSPTKDKHTDARENLGGLLRLFVDLRKTGKLYSETAMIALTRNDYLPDIVFFSKAKAAAFHPDTWKYPSPDFVVEVLSDSTEDKDRGIKKEDYAVHGVGEYWLVDTDLQTVEQYLPDNEKQAFFLFAKKTVTDHIQSRVIEGFDIPVAAIFDEDLKVEIMRKWLK